MAHVTGPNVPQVRGAGSPCQTLGYRTSQCPVYISSSLSLSLSLTQLEYTAFFDTWRLPVRRKSPLLRMCLHLLGAVSEQPAATTARSRMQHVAWIALWVLDQHTGSPARTIHWVGLHHKKKIRKKIFPQTSENHNLFPDRGTALERQVVSSCYISDESSLSYGYRLCMFYRKPYVTCLYCVYRWAMLSGLYTVS